MVNDKPKKTAVKHSAARKRRSIPMDFSQLTEQWKFFTAQERGIQLLKRDKWFKDPNIIEHTDSISGITKTYNVVYCENWRGNKTDDDPFANMGQ